MESRVIKELLKVSSDNCITVSAVGTSMNPSIREGDVLHVSRKLDYELGDILLFEYHGDLLVHRALRKIPGGFWCKGDNSFRIESVTDEKVIGVVDKICDRTIEKVSEEFLRDSLCIGKLFIMRHYDKEQVIRSQQYQKYVSDYLD